MTITGLDVSVYQQPTPDLTGHDLLIARACYGTFPDGTYAGHIATAKAAGLLTGAYCFGRTVEDPEAQAATLLATAGDVDLLVLDVETDGSHSEMTEAQCREFLAYVKARDARPVWLYHSRSGFPADAYGFDGRWVADYGMNTGQPGRPPAIPWDLWQYTSNPIDTNQFAGTRDELAALLGREAAMPGFGFKIVGAAVAVQVRPDEGHLLINPARTEPAFYGPGNWGPSPNSLPVDLIDPADDQPIDVNGNKPPQGGRDQCYLYDDGKTFGRAALALRSDCDVLAVPAPPATVTLGPGLYKVP